MPILDDGEIIRDNFEVERLLGRGGFAEVYRVRHRFLHRRLALKVFKTPIDSLDRLNELLEESRLLTALEHPNIVRLHDAALFAKDGERYGCFSMEHVAGGSLDRYWSAYGARLMPVAEAVDVVLQACRGLAQAHTKQPPIVHRDVKPQNILIGYDGEGLRVRVGDFGLAKAVSPLTLLASAQGTLAFKPPEALDGQDSTRADVWGLGTTLYLLLTDRQPFPQLDGRDLGDARRFLRPLRPPSVYNIGVDAALDAIVFRCLAAEPADRYADAAELLGELARWQPDPTSDPFTAQMSSSGPEAPLAKVAAADGSFERVEDLVREAFHIAKTSGQLDSAADLLERAINRKPELRERYAPRLQLWRRGTWM